MSAISRMWSIVPDVMLLTTIDVAAFLCRSNEIEKKNPMRKFNESAFYPLLPLRFNWMKGICWLWNLIRSDSLSLPIDWLSSFPSVRVNDSFIF